MRKIRSKKDRYTSGYLGRDTTVDQTGFWRNRRLPYADAFGRDGDVVCQMRRPLEHGVRIVIKDGGLEAQRERTYFAEDYDRASACDFGEIFRRFSFRCLVRQGDLVEVFYLGEFSPALYLGPTKAGFHRVETLNSGQSFEVSIFEPYEFSCYDGVWAFVPAASPDDGGEWRPAMFLARERDGFRVALLEREMVVQHVKHPEIGGLTDDDDEVMVLRHYEGRRKAERQSRHSALLRPKGKVVRRKHS
jgi:hypothetical protein